MRFTVLWYGTTANASKICTISAIHFQPEERHQCSIYWTVSKSRESTFNPYLYFQKVVSVLHHQHLTNYEVGILLSVYQSRTLSFQHPHSRDGMTRMLQWPTETIPFGQAGRQAFVEMEINHHHRNQPLQGCVIIIINWGQWWPTHYSSS